MLASGPRTPPCRGEVNPGESKSLHQPMVCYQNTSVSWKNVRPQTVPEPTAIALERQLKVPHCPPDQTVLQQQPNRWAE